jgi:flagellar biosynthesis/type III secretory pathway protein FliH
MTSSLKATGQASLRVTPSVAVTNAAPWALTDLAATPRSGVSSTITAEARAQLIAEGYTAGFADGQKNGVESAQVQVKQSLVLIEKLLEQIQSAASLAPSILEENVSALAVIVARQIVSREVWASPEIVADLVRRALTEFPVEQAVRIRVNPLDLSMLTIPGASDDKQPITGTREASWMADPRIARGGCLIEGRDRIVDGRIDAALERLYHRMAAIDAS